MVQNTVNIVLNQEVDCELKYPISLYTGIKSTSAKLFYLSWEKLCTQLANPFISEVKDVPLFGPYSLSEAKRGNNNVIEVSLLVFDIDDSQGKSANDIVNLVQGYDAVAHTTWSHTEQEPRYRLIVRLLKSVPVKHFTAVRDGFLSLNPELALIIDKGITLHMEK